MGDNEGFGFLLVIYDGAIVVLVCILMVFLFFVYCWFFVYC